MMRERVKRGVATPLIAEGPGRALLIAVDVAGAVPTGRDAASASTDTLSTYESLEELGALCQAAGAEVVGQLVQRREMPDPRSYFGEGKLNELAEMVLATGADLVVSDDELRPAQLRKLEAALPDVRVIDRTQLILDIFAQRAQTAEGKLQVELAQLRYRLPRLSGIGTSLSRQGGGIGARGPGETKLATDRRHIRNRLAELRVALTRVRERRERQRRARQVGLHPIVALVGYTNAGKSTLLNVLSGAGVSAVDRVFETLDPTVREVELPGGDRILLADTVGFIQKLPHELVAAFRATLEEVVEADLLLHVVDVSNPRWEAQASAVFEVLENLGCAGKPTVTAFNKWELTTPEQRDQVRRVVADAVPISARNGDGLEQLLRAVRERLPEQRVEKTYRFGFGEAATLKLLHEFGRVFETNWDEEGALVHCEVRRSLANRLAAFECPAAAAPARDHQPV